MSAVNVQFFEGGIFLSNPFMCKVKTKTEKYFFFAKDSLWGIRTPGPCGKLILTYALQEGRPSKKPNFENLDRQCYQLGRLALGIFVGVGWRTLLVQIVVPV